MLGIWQPQSEERRWRCAQSGADVTNRPMSASVNTGTKPARFCVSMNAHTADTSATAHATIWIRNALRRLDPSLSSSKPAAPPPPPQPHKL